MKIYRRADGFEVHDVKDRPLEWAVKTYGGNFVEIVPTEQPTMIELNEIAEVKQSKRDDVLKKIGITQEEWDILRGI